MFHGTIGSGPDKGTTASNSTKAGGADNYGRFDNGSGNGKCCTANPQHGLHFSIARLGFDVVAYVMQCLLARFLFFAKISSCFAVGVLPEMSARMRATDFLLIDFTKCSFLVCCIRAGPFPLLLNLLDSLNSIDSFRLVAAAERINVQ